MDRKVRDGMICFEKGIILCVSLADCAGVLIFDPVKNIISALHSGWKGSKLNITRKGIEIMKNHGSNPKDLLVWISPSASGEKYEIGEDVAKHFMDSECLIPLNPLFAKGKTKYLFHNKFQIKKQLIVCGVNVDNIEISQICTINDIEYHSYRRDRQLSGRMAAFIGML